MRLGRLFFAGAIVLALAYFALRSPLPVADARFLKQDYPEADAPLSLSAYLEPGAARDRGRAELDGAAAQLRQAAGAASPATLDAARAEALEAAATRLKAAGIASVMLRYGDALVVRGRRGGAPWRIGLRNPGSSHPDDALAYLLAEGAEAIASHGGDRIVTVVASDAPTAATGAAALHAAGPDQWRELARSRGLAQVMVVDAGGAIAVTPALAGRLKFLHGRSPRVLP